VKKKVWLLSKLDLAIDIDLIMPINQISNRSSNSRFTRVKAIDLYLVLGLEKLRLRAKSITLKLQQQLTQMGLPNDDLRDR
jgi:hypothetical protein